MRFLRSGILLAAALGAGNSALAGAGEVNAAMVPLSSPVTYSVAGTATTDPLVTYIGYTLQLSNNSGNTINSVRFTVTISATDSAEVVTLFNPSLYLPPSCTSSSSTTSSAEFTCTVGQMKNGATFPATPFPFFYTTPVKVSGGLGDVLGSDIVNANVHIVYAEGTGGVPNSVPGNSMRDWPAGPVTLGTVNPVEVKSAVPKNGGTFYTGTGGIPSNGSKLTELVKIPTLTGTTYATAAINIAATLDTDTGDPQCGNLGHFSQCPTYATLIPERQFPTSPWLTTIYRIDVSNLKMSASKILNSVVLTYFKSETALPQILGACTNAAPSGDGIPCVLTSFCYKRTTPGWQPDLDGDCEWQVINTENGFIKIQ